MTRLASALAALVASAGLAADPAPAGPSEAVKKRLTEPVLEMLRNAESVEAFRVGKLDYKDTGTADHVGLRQAVGEGKVMPKEYRDKVVAALLLDNTYAKGDSKGTSVGVGYRIKTRDGGRVEVSFCLEKGNVQLAVVDKAGKLIKSGDQRGFRDDPAHPLRFLAEEAFPDDADVKKVMARIRQKVGPAPAPRPAP